jgi:hypothetical protein
VGLKNENIIIRMKIGIHQCDGHYPNLAIMKIAGYHESKGDFVEWYNGDLFAPYYDKIYMSKIFSFTPMPSLPDNVSSIACRRQA